MVQLKIREKIKINFNDDMFFFLHGEKSYDYEYNRKEIYIKQLAGETDEGYLYGLLKPNTTYRVKIYANDVASSSASRFWLSNIDGSGEKYSNSFTNYNISEGNPRFEYIPYLGSNELFTTDDSGNIKWSIKGSGSNPGNEYADVKLISIEFSENGYNVVDILDSENGVKLNKSIKEISEPDKYKISFSNGFKLPITENLSKLIRYKNEISNSEYEYEGVLSDDDGFNIMNGILIFTEIDEKDCNGFDLIKATLYQKGSDFFEKLKVKTIGELDFMGGEITQSHMYSSMTSNNSTYYYGIIDNGNIDTLSLDSGTRGSNVCSYNGFSVSSYLSDFSAHDVYPSLFVKSIWDKIHEENGMNYTGNFFETEIWNNLLINNWENFNKTNEEIEEQKCSAELFIPLHTVSHNSNNTVDTFDKWVTNINIEGNSQLHDFLYIPYPVNRNNKVKLKMKIKVSIKADENYERYDDEQQQGKKIKLGFHLNVRYGATTEGPNYVAGPNGITGERVTDDAAHSFLYYQLVYKELSNWGSNPDEYELEIDEELDYNTFLHNAVYGIHVVLTPEIYQQWDENDNWFINPYDDVYTIEVEGGIAYEPIKKITPGETFSFSDVAPTMKQIDFIKDIANVFNLRFVLDEETNTINWYTFEEYYMEISNIKDFSEKIKKDKVKKVLGNNWQSKTTDINYKKNVGNLINNYNSSYLLQYGSSHFEMNGDALKLHQDYNIDISIQAFSYLMNNKIPITNNNENKLRRFSSVNHNKMSKNVYLSYRNIIDLDDDIIFRDENMKRWNLNKVPTSTHILKHKLSGDTVGDVITLEFMKSNYNNSEWRTPTKNQYDYFFKSDFEDIIGKNAEKLEVQLNLSNLEFFNLKLNNIINIEDDLYRIDSIKNFNENSLTNLDLIKISFNANYDGTIYSPAPYISPTPPYNSFHTNTINQFGSYTSPIQSFDVEFGNLDDDLIVKCSTDSNTNEYEINVAGGGWQSLNQGTSIVVSSLTEGLVTIEYRLVGVSGSQEPGTLYRAYWDFTSNFIDNNIKERVTLWCKVKETPGIVIGGKTATLENNLNVYSLASGDKISVNELKTNTFN